jgi:hypothetical protein
LNRIGAAGKNYYRDKFGHFINEFKGKYSESSGFRIGANPARGAGAAPRLSPGLEAYDLTFG